MSEVNLRVSDGSSSASINEPIEAVANSTDISIGRLFQFLLGSRPAILAFASHRDTFWLGLVLVISAGIVREHHQINWLQHPWLIALPLIATVALSLVLFPVVIVVARWRGAKSENYWGRFRVFLGLLWMTAPLAWIFILPVEQLMSADDAAIIRLWFLGFVALWRVFLVTRILSTLFVGRANDVYFTGTLFVVMLVVDTLFLCRFRGNHLVMMVGNISETPVAEFVVLHAMAVMTVIGVITWPIWLVGTLFVALGEGTRWAWTVKDGATSGRLTTGVKVLATASVLIWVVLFPLKQPRQQGRPNRDPSLQTESMAEPAGFSASRVDGVMR